MCGGFTCSKNALTALNLLYIIVSFILIGVATYASVASYIANLKITGGIVACGVFLLLVAIMGLIGAVKHHQVLLFFYMVILFLIFLVQFGVACACLALSHDQQKKLAFAGWNSTDRANREGAEKYFHCCGFSEEEPRNCTNICSGPTCPYCWNAMYQAMNSALKITGGIGLFFSFTEFIGVWLTVRYRNQKDPKANPSAFL